MKNEPLITIASITAGATALLGLLTAFGIPITQDQQIAILGVVAVAAPFVVAFAARGQVTPNSSVVEYSSGKTVLAGEANELPTDTAIRELDPAGVEPDEQEPDEAIVVNPYDVPEGDDK